MIRLGGAIVDQGRSPESWLEMLKKYNYSAAVFPGSVNLGDPEVGEFIRLAEEHNICIAEIGAWSNPLSLDPEERRKALQHCIDKLALADEVGALCCVNIAGSFSDTWDGPDAKNFTQEAFDATVESVRKIIDAVKPKRTFYTLEPMPWMYPYSTETYLELIRAVNRPQFAVHFDPVNMITSPYMFYHNGEFLREFIRKLGPYIKSCHAKDIVLDSKLTVHLQEVRPGLGELDYTTFLTELAKLGTKVPLIIEHLDTEDDYGKATAYIRDVARECGVKFV